MKLYYFKDQSYGEFYLVMASSLEKALESLKSCLKKQIERRYNTRDDGSRYETYEYEEYRKWKDAKIDQLPKDYSLEVLEENEVFEGEWA